MLTVTPPVKGGKRLKVYYATQSDVAPPTFVMFVNDGTIMTESYRRFLENSIRQAVDFSGTPIDFVIKNKLKNADFR